MTAFPEQRRRATLAAAKRTEQTPAPKAKPSQSKLDQVAPLLPQQQVGGVKDQVEEEEDEDDFDEGEDGFLEEEDENEDSFDVGSLGLSEDYSLPGVSTGGTAWGEAALKAAQKVLRAPVLEGLELYLFRAVVPVKKLDVRLDQLGDIYGSPSIDNIEKFSRMLALELEAQIGAEAAGEISFEVSSPGAERQLRLPDDLDRFRELPMRVEYTDEAGVPAMQILELTLHDAEAGSSEWRVADVRANAPAKGRKLSKKQREQKFVIPVASLTRVRVWVDF